MADNQNENIRKKAQETATVVEEALRGIAGQIGDIFERALAGADKVTQATAKDLQASFNKFAKISDDISSNIVKIGQGTLTIKNIQNQINARKSQETALGVKLLINLRQQGVQAENIEELIEKQNNGTLSLSRKQKDLVKQYIEAKGYNEELTAEYERQIKLVEKQNKNLGLTGATLTGISKIPVLGQLIKSEEILEETRKEAAKDNTNRLKVAGAATKAVFKSLGESLTDPLVIGGLLIKAFKFLLDLGFKVDKQVVAMSRSMAISKQEATIMRDRFVQIQNAEQSIFETTENLVNAQLELGQAFGATRGFAEQQLKDQILLTKQMGLTTEEAAGLQQLSLANGMSADDVLKSTVKQTAALAKQTGIQLDNKKVLGEVAKVSGQLRLQYKNNPELLAKAVVQTEKLGISLEKAKDIANSLLDFESSISAELEAELLTGKQINLEEARLLALNGKSAEAAAEISKQIGTAAEFSSMNVLQQDAYAKALGMSSDELANMLLYNENINKLGSNTKKQIEDQIKLAKQQGDTEKVQMLERSVGNEEQALAALKQIDAQEKFNQSIEKLKSMLSDLVAGPAMGLAKGLANMLSNTDNIKQAFSGIAKIVGGISLARMIGQTLALAGAQAIAAAGAITWASGITLGLGILGIIAGMAAAKSGYDDITNSMQTKAQQTPPGLKVGGTVVGEGAIMVGEEGPEILSAQPGATVTPLSKVNAATEASSKNSPNVVVKGGETSLTIDGTTFARLVTPFIVTELDKRYMQLQ